ncbi:MAG: hypothetical protein JWM74_3868 [Myxococcaceae bacterium]|nr:hypothetical protein [Myxococcaceae bacterium]
MAVSALLAVLVLPVASCGLEIGGQPGLLGDDAAIDAELPDVVATDGTIEDSASSDALVEASNDAGSEAGDASVDTGIDACLPLPAGWSVAMLTGGACASGFTGPIAFVESPSVGATPCSCSCGAQASNPCLHGGSTVFRVHVNGNGGACGTPGNFAPTGACETGGSWDNGIDMVSGSPEPPINVACAATAVKPPLAATSSFNACLVAGFGDAGAGASACLPSGSGSCIAKPGIEPTCPGDFTNRRVVTRTTDVVDQRTCGACTCNTTATTCTNATLSFWTSNSTCSGTTTHVAQLNGLCSAFDGNFNPQAFRYDATPSPNACAPSSATSPIGGTVTSSAQSTICCTP